MNIKDLNQQLNTGFDNLNQLMKDKSEVAKLRANPLQYFKDNDMLPDASKEYEVFFNTDNVWYVVFPANDSTEISDEALSNIAAAKSSASVSSVGTASTAGTASSFPSCVSSAGSVGSVSSGGSASSK